MLIANCALCARNGGLVLEVGESTGPHAMAVIRDSTLASVEPLGFHFRESPQAVESPRLTYELTRTVLHAAGGMVRAAAVGDRTATKEARLDWLTRAVAWKDDRLVYSCPAGRYVAFWPESPEPVNRFTTLAAWNELRGLPTTRAVEGVCQFAGGDEATLIGAAVEYGGSRQ
jgi:hypothetical protein